MNNFLKSCLVLLVLFTLNYSCRKEEIELIQAPTENILTANSAVSSLMQKVSINDGSNDNIIDKANCFNIKLPITVTVNGEILAIDSKNDYKIIEYLFDEEDDDYDNISISFPITIILDDFSEIIINNNAELNNYTSLCNGENESDDDIECIDFQYPIKASIFNKISEKLTVVSITSDKELYDFIENINNDDVVAINFPVFVSFSDGTEQTITSLVELKDAIDTHKNDCDEDDDYDYNDDDCNDCQVEALKAALTQCGNWTVDKLKRYNYNYDNTYNGYAFNFFENGTLTAKSYSNTYNGTWSASGSGNNLTVVINVPNLPYCNNNWILHEISSYTETKIDFRVGYNDRMRYTNDCN